MKRIAYLILLMFVLNGCQDSEFTDPSDAKTGEYTADANSGTFFTNDWLATPEGSVFFADGTQGQLIVTGGELELDQWTGRDSQATYQLPGLINNPNYGTNFDPLTTSSSNKLRITGGMKFTPILAETQMFTFEFGILGNQDLDGNGFDDSIFYRIEIDGNGTTDTMGRIRIERRYQMSLGDSFEDYTQDGTDYVSGGCFTIENPNLDEIEAGGGTVTGDGTDTGAGTPSFDDILNYCDADDSNGFENVSIEFDDAFDVDASDPINFEILIENAGTADGLAALLTITVNGTEHTSQDIVSAAMDDNAEGTDEEGTSLPYISYTTDTDAETTSATVSDEKSMTIWRTLNENTLIGNVLQFTLEQEHGFTNGIDEPVSADVQGLTLTDLSVQNK